MPQGCWEDLSDPQDMSVGLQEGIHGVEGQAGSQICSYHELGKQWSMHCSQLACIARISWQAFLNTAGHQRVLLPPQPLAGVQDPAECGHAVDSTAQLLFTLKGKGPGTPPLSLELDQVSWFQLG